MVTKRNQSLGIGRVCIMYILGHYAFIYLRIKSHVKKSNTISSIDLIPKIEITLIKYTKSNK